VRHQASASSTEGLLRQRSIEAEYYDCPRRRSLAERLAGAAGRLDVSLGRLIYESTTPASNHLRGRVELFRARAARGPRSSGAGGSESSRGIADFSARGFLHLPDGLFGPRLVAAVAEAVADRIESHRHSIRTGQNLAAQDRMFPGRSLARRLLDPREIPEIEALVSDGLRHVVEGCYRSNVAIISVECYRTYHVEPEVRSRIDTYSHWWHCDQRPIDICKVFVNLSRVTPVDGPFSALTIDASRQLLKSPSFRGRTDADFEIAPHQLPRGQLAQLVGPPGAGMICNTQLCLHRAGIPDPGRHRDVLQLVFMAARRPLPTRWLAATDPMFGKRSRYYRPPPAAE
jgi:hypothetical protein